jgi:hypothetical protein
MHVRKALDELLKLTESPANLDTLTKATMLVDGMLRSNDDPNEGRRNEMVISKLESARRWFETLCGLGEEDGTPERARYIIRTELAPVRDAIEPDSNGLYFKPWPK